MTSLSADKLHAIITTQALLVSGDFDLSAFMNIVVDRVLGLTQGTGAAVELIDGEEMVYQAASGSIAAYVGLRLRLSNSLSGHCVRTASITISDDTTCDSRVDAEACRKVNAASMVIVPLFRKGETVGVLKIVSDKPRAFGSEDVQTLQLMAGLLGGALGQQLEVNERQALEEKLRQMAQEDPLTGLPNRALFHDRLAQAVARGKRGKGCLAVMYIDLDYFKQVNDTYGHESGDAVLTEFSSRLRSLVRESDTLARLGGDEFALIVENIPGRWESEMIAHKVIAATDQTFDVPNGKARIGVTVGIALGNSTSTDGAELLRHADAALYEAKQAGRGVCRLRDLRVPLEALR
jgi:diguanylate cyclase (GGDEF)-like protein